MILASGEEEPIFGGEGIPNQKLNLKFTHTRDPAVGVQLSDGEMTSKVTQLVKADPLGLGGKVDIGEEVQMGAVTIYHVKQVD